MVKNMVEARTAPYMHMQLTGNLTVQHPLTKPFKFHYMLTQVRWCQVLQISLRAWCDLTYTPAEYKLPRKFAHAIRLHSYFNLCSSTVWDQSRAHFDSETSHENVSTLIVPHFLQILLQRGMREWGCLRFIEL